MISFRSKKAFILLISVVIAFAGYRLVRYFIDSTAPLIVIRGIEQNHAYAGDVQCILSGHDGYGVGTISLWLDDKALAEKHRIGRKTFEYPFLIATQPLSDGEHKLKIEVQDSSFHKNTTRSELTFSVDNVPLQAAFTVSEPAYKTFQGKTLRIQFQTNKTLCEAHVDVLSGRYPCVAEGTGAHIYECFIPVKSDEPANEYPIIISFTDRVGNHGTLEGKLNVVMFPFKKQTLGLSKEKVQEEESKGQPERLFEEAMVRLTHNSPKQKLWKGAFYVPCDLKSITTDFGTLRISQQRGKYRHDAIDIAAAPKSVIWAAQDGVIVLKDRFVHSGNTVVIDHGCGIMTLYFHLETFKDIKIGELVRKGKPLGTLGMTGYASGYHLHWELRINNTPVDPMQWTQYDF